MEKISVETIAYMFSQDTEEVLYFAYSKDHKYQKYLYFEQVIDLMNRNFIKGKKL